MFRSVFYFFVFVCLALFLDSDYTYALKTDFHGHLKSNYVLRDTNGFQNKFMDSVTCSQWLTELKFDLTVRPEDVSFAGFKLSKIFLTYRGAYDAVFDVTDRWDNVRDKSPSDFELGKDDLKVENDLREAFVDFTTRFGSQQSIAVRLGRQIVQWGEADGFNVVNIVNPQDNRNKMFFDNPEDLATPLWMGRVDYSSGMLGPFNSIDLQFVLIPDIRPHQFAPLDQSSTDPYDNNNAPYAFGFKYVKDWGIPALTELVEPLLKLHNILPPDSQIIGIIDEIGMENGISVNDGSNIHMSIAPQIAELLGGEYAATPAIEIKERVPSSNIDNMEYGGKLRVSIADSEFTFYYLRSYADDAGIDLSRGFTESALYLDHPKQDMYGFSFNTYVPSINAVIRGEANIVSKVPFYDTADPFTALFYGTLPEELFGPAIHIFQKLEFGLDPSMKGYTMHRVYQSLLGFDKSFWLRFLNPRNMINASLQAYWKHIDDWEYDPVHRPWDQEDNYRFTGLFYTHYNSGRIFPQLFVMYDTEDAWMTSFSVKYTRDGKWFYKLGLMAFWGEEPNGDGSSGNGYSKNAVGPFTAPVNLMKTSELSFTVGYNW